VQSIPIAKYRLRRVKRKFATIGKLIMEKVLNFNINILYVHCCLNGNWKCNLEDKRSTWQKENKTPTSLGRRPLQLGTETGTVSVKPTFLEHQTRDGVRPSIHPSIHPYIIPFFVSRHVYSLRQYQFSTQCDLALPLSIYKTLSFIYGHPVAAYVFFLVFPFLSPFLLSFL